MLSDLGLEYLLTFGPHSSSTESSAKALYSRHFDVDYKGPQDPVTEADRRANALICERLEQEFPGVPIVAEESDPSAFANFLHQSSA